MAQAQGPQAQQQQQMQQIYQATVQAIKNYQANPAAFNEGHLKAMKKAADMFGIPFEVPFSAARAFKKGAYELGEGLTLGLLPNSLDPGAMNTGESIAGGVGGLLGLAAPAGLAFKGIGFAGKVAARAAAGESVTAGALTKYLATTPPAIRKYLEGGAAGVSKVLQSAFAKKFAKQATAFAATHPTAFKAIVGGPLFLASKNLLQGAPDEEQLMEPSMEAPQ